MLLFFIFFVLRKGVQYFYASERKKDALLRDAKQERRERGDSNTQVHSTIFSKYVVLPITTFPPLII
jgi:hypothetical protein